MAATDGPALTDATVPLEIERLLAELAKARQSEPADLDGDGHAEHDQGGDQVYACGRYCGGCQQRGPGAPADSSVDCARCGETAQEKARCGVQHKGVEAECPTAALCHGGIGANAPCDQCKGLQDQACDGTPLGEAEFSCCAVCPDGFDRSIDLSCGSDAIDDWGSCANTPPGC